MKIVIQKVLEANVKVNQEVVASIKQGYLLFVGVTDSDNEEIADKLAKKVMELRIFEDEFNKMNLAISQFDYEILSVSQFTLYANCSRGRRPSFDKASKAEVSKPIYDYFNQRLIHYGAKLKTGIFQEDMKVSLVNDGPCTIILDSEDLC